MKCPYRKEVIHYPEQTIGYVKEYARDIEEFADCYEKECPFYMTIANGRYYCAMASSEVKNV